MHMYNTLQFSAIKMRQADEGRLDAQCSQLRSQQKSKRKNTMYERPLVSYLMDQV